MKLSIILASYDSGRPHAGFGQGPDAIVDGGLVEALALAGHQAVVADIDNVGPDQGREIATGFAVCKAVAAQVAFARGEGRFPIVLAGNCLTVAGAVAGEEADSIVWIDQHGDLNTPETSIHGFLDGMALATVLGLCWKPMAEDIPEFRPIDQARCMLAGVRDLDPAEVAFLKTSPIIQAKCDEAPAQAARLRQAGATRTHLHVDLDVHDPDALQVNRYAEPGGPSPEQLCRTVRALAEALPITCITLTAYDPAFDSKGEVPPAVGRLLTEFLAAVERK